MGAITYIANARAPLMTTPSPVHEAGSEYSLDVRIPAWDVAIEAPKTQHVSLGGSIETVLQRTSEIQQITILWDDVDQEQMREFLYSIAGGETFQIDPYGTVASPDAPFDVALTNQQLSEARLIQTSTPWRSITLALRTVPV